MFLNERVDEERKQREKLDKETFDDYFLLKKSKINFELKTEHWVHCFQELVINFNHNKLIISIIFCLV